MSLIAYYLLAHSPLRFAPPAPVLPRIDSIDSIYSLEFLYNTTRTDSKVTWRMLCSVSSRFAAGLVALAILPTALATITCDANNLCPESAPCCSQYGECGIGAYCLGGCNPKFSFAVESCAPQPICVDGSYTFANLNSLESNTKYLGDSSQADFVYTGYPLESNGDLLVTMPNQSTGTVVASSTYVWYGKVDVVMKSSRGQGVVTAFILFSDVQDEIDYEFVGADLGTVQTNFYYQGILDWFNSENISLSDTFANWHTYTVDWQQDYIQWSVDGQVGRTLYKNSTLNTTSGEYNFPQTPSRVQLSLWPGGLASNAPGTIAWAGGEINWDSEDIQQYGYDYAIVKSVNVQCYSPPSFANQSGKSYRYVNRNGTQESVIITNEDTVLASFDASGTDMSAGGSSSSSSSSSSTTSSSSSTMSIPNVSMESSSSASTSTSSVLTASVPTVPGGDGGGNDLQRGSSSSSSQSIVDASMVSQSTSTTSSSSSSSSSGSSSSSITSTTGNGSSGISRTSTSTTASSTSSAGSGFSQGGTISANAGTAISPASLVVLITFIFGFFVL